MTWRWTYQWLPCLCGRHVMAGCQCAFCSYHHPEESASHIWNDSCTCETCGAVRSEGHAYDEWGKCTKCGRMHPEAKVCPDCQGFALDFHACLACAWLSGGDFDSVPASRCLPIECVKASGNFQCKTCEGHGATARLAVSTEA